MIKKTVIDFDWKKWITSHLILEHIELCGRITFMFFVDIFHCRKKIARFFTRSDLGYAEERKVLSKRVEKLFDFRYYSTSSQPSHIRLCQALCAMRKSNWFSSFLLSFLMKYMTSFDGFSTFITALLISLKLASRQHYWRKC